MEGIEAEVEKKSIEKSVEIVIKEEPKPKKPRSQAQKDAFEKARKKRAENLIKKKAEEAEYEEEDYEEEPVVDIKPPPKRRGRPKKAMKNKEPKQVSFIPPPDPQLYSHYPYQVQNQAQPQFNPYNYWGGGIPPHQAPAPAPAPQPVNNYYYYGEPPHTPQTSKYERQSEPSPEGSIDEDYEEAQEEAQEEEIEYPEPAPQLKYRFA